MALGLEAWIVRRDEGCVSIVLTFVNGEVRGFSLNCDEAKNLAAAIKYAVHGVTTQIAARPAARSGGS